MSTVACTRQALVDKIRSLSFELRSAQEQLDRLIRACNHQWGKTEYVPEYQPGYEIPGDPPGTMGVDWRPSCYVSPRTVQKWRRTCSICGHSEETTQSIDRVTKEPRF